ncbi:plasmid recombination protein [Lactobacillus johnsonii]|uniref:plasmid recombination protein n=1 Tax=Lactobacillus johnsonii TaxID=33959 RepID=UPI00200A26D8|nr:plasmid recombination protein [Lactobacillus johnsonii]
MHEDIRDIYNQEFGQAVKDYNAKQKRKDRRIKDYYSKIKNSKKTRTQYEFIVQVGNINDYRHDENRITSQTWQTSKKILENYFDNFQKRNPNLIPYNAVIHMDEEGAPHMHLNVVPVAHDLNAKQGVKVKPVLNKALAEEGFSISKKDNRKQWRDFQHREAEALADEALLYGITRKAGITNKLKDVRQYKQVMREIDDLEEQKSQIYTEFEDKKAQIDNLDQRELEISRREQAAANKETKNKNLDKEIRRKEFILNDLDQKEQNTRDNWSQWVRTTEKLTKKRRLGTPDDYLVVGTFGTVDKEASKRKIANLIDLAEHGKLIKEVEAENRQLRNQGIDQFRGFVRQEKRLGDEQRQRELEELRKKNKEQEEKIKDQQRQILQLRMFAEATVKTIRGIAKAIPEKAHALWQKIGSNLRKVGGKTYVKMNADEVKEANKGYSAETEKQKSIYNQRYNSRDLDL